MDYITFMNGLSQALYDKNICKDCGGTGWKPLMCCNGRECGCMGMPIDNEYSKSLK